MTFWQNTMSQPSTHPHFNDQSAVMWHNRLADALAEAQAAGKHVFIEFGRFM